MYTLPLVTLRPCCNGDQDDAAATGTEPGALRRGICEVRYVVFAAVAVFSAPVLAEGRGDVWVNNQNQGVVSLAGRSQAEQSVSPGWQALIQ